MPDTPPDPVAEMFAVTGLTEADAAALDELAADGIGEGDFDGDNHSTPAAWIALHEAVEAKEAGLL